MSHSLSPNRMKFERKKNHIQKINDDDDIADKDDSMFR